MKKLSALIGRFTSAKSEQPDAFEQRLRNLTATTARRPKQKAPSPVLFRRGFAQA